MIAIAYSIISNEARALDVVSSDAGERLIGAAWCSGVRRLELYGLTVLVL